MLRAQKHRGLTASCIQASRAIPLLLVSLWACTGHRDPQAALDKARQTYRRGDITAALKEAEEGYQEFHGLSTEWAWNFAILRANALHAQGKENEVLNIIASEPNPPTSGDLAIRKLRVESAANTSLGKSNDAALELNEAERLCAASDSPACAGVFSVRGQTEMGHARYAEGQILFARGLASARAGRDQFLEADAMLNLSWAANEQTHFDEALDWAGEARRISAKSDYAGITEIALGNMGWAYYKLGESEKAEQLTTEAWKQAKQLGYLTDEIRWLTSLAYIEMDAGKVEGAARSFHDALDLAKQVKSREDVGNSVIALAFVSEQTGKLGEAKQYADEALSMARADNNKRDEVYPLLVHGRIAAQQHNPATAETAFRQVAESKDSPVFLKWEAERSLARLYEDKNRPDAADREYRTALTTFESARCDLHQREDSRLPFLSNAARIYEDYTHFLVGKGKTNDALRAAEYTRARTLAEGLGRPCKGTFAPDQLDATAIARRAGGTVLFYALGEKQSYLWAITPNQVSLFPLTATKSEIDSAVQRYRKKLEGPPDILAASNDGSVLYKMLVEPAQEILRKQSLAKNDRVFIVPDGSLNSLNFETLVPQPNHYWIEDVTITNAGSLRLIPAARARSQKFDGSLLLIGNPVAPDPGPDNAYPELPNSATEMASVEKHFPAAQQKVFAREQAVPAAYLNGNPEQFSYIHFVAHGTASRTSPLDSAIILSRETASKAATQEDDSFKLYAREIIRHPLRAELVTISACYSQGNRAYSGEGLVGLSWAFLRSGAHNVIGALWDVSDASVTQLMDEFYSALQKGRSPDAALRAAKLSLLHSETPAYRRPFYWAPFQLYTGSQESARPSPQQARLSGSIMRDSPAAAAGQPQN